MLPVAGLPRFTSISNLIKTGSIQTTIFSCNKLLEFYFKHGFSHDAQNLFDEMPQKNVFTWNNMIHGCITNNDVLGACWYFDSAPVRDSVTYNSMISGCAGNLCDSEAIELLDEMRRSGVQVDSFTLSTMLNVSARLCNVDYGRQLHALAVKSSNDSDGFGLSSLIDMYSKCGCFLDAFSVFSGSGEMGLMDLVSKNAMVAACCREGAMDIALDLFSRVPVNYDVISWNTMISGCAQNGRAEMALLLFIAMADDGIQRNEHTIAGVLTACSGLKSLKQGKQIHAWVLKHGLDVNPFISSSIVDLYCKCGKLRYAESVYSRIQEENIFSATSMIIGYAQEGKMEEARKLFDSLNERNSVVWTSMLNRYVKSQQCDEVFNLIGDAARRHDLVVSDVLVLITVLGACAIQAHLDQGKQVHAYMIRIGIRIEGKIGAALVNMYGKCGNIKYAQVIFHQTPIKDRVLFNAIISGFAHNGRELEAILLFHKMLVDCIQPDAATFIAVLSACRHAGLVEKGEKYFNDMMPKYGIVPEIDHYSSMVDLFGRANQLDKAVSLISRIPFEPDIIVWGTLLNACRLNKNTELARETEEIILRMEAGNGARYVQLANVFASKGEWDEVERIRRKMRGGDVKKIAGCSWLQVGKKMNIFTSGDRFHSEVDAVYDMLGVLNAEITDKSWVAV